MSMDIDDVSPGGSPILVHSREKDFTPAQGESHIEAISAHIERHLGPISGVFHEIISDLVHIDVHVVPASEPFPYLRLVTSGMSDLPMTLPGGAPGSAYMELMVTLPADWPISADAFEDERNYWPVRLLKTLARLPHEYDTWLGFGHTIPNGHPAEPSPRAWVSMAPSCCRRSPPPRASARCSWTTPGPSSSCPSSRCTRRRWT